jgi:NitT/TauT family transport system substrate-binding protein
MVTARWLAVALLALCSVLFSPALATAQAKVKLVLDWQIQGPQAPFITAKATGAFTRQGLDVTIDRGTGSQKTIELVATGTYDIGYGDVNSMIARGDVGAAPGAPPAPGVHRRARHP